MMRDKSSYSYTKKILAILTMLALLLTMVPVSAIAATDTAGHWAEGIISQMVEKGISGGYPDGTFKPDNRITRAEFASILVRAFKLEGLGNHVFSDTNGHWAQEVIADVYNHGIVSGYPNNIFKPDASITREQMAAMIVNAVEKQSIPQNTVPTTNLSDLHKTADWAVVAVNKAIRWGLIGGYPDKTFKPQGFTTRAEALAVLSRILVESPSQTTYNKAGVYGSTNKTTTINSDVVISVDGVTLQNFIIAGDLVISKEVGNGDATLNNVTVKGTTYIRGGGENSIHLNGGEYNKIIIAKTREGNLRIITEDLYGLQIVIAENAPNQTIILAGRFNTVEVAEGCQDVTLAIPSNASVYRLVLNSATVVNNEFNTISVVEGSQAELSQVGNLPYVEAYVEEIAPSYLLNTTVNDPARGSVSGGGSYTEGEKITLAAIPAEGYIFARWFVNGELAGTEATFEYTTMAANTNLIAYFIPAGFTPIATAAELDNVRTAMELNYMQIADIDLGVAPYNEGTGWAPIGIIDQEAKSIAGLSGIYDGDGNIINNLTINDPDIMLGGLFIYSSGTVQNLTLANVNIVGKETVCGLVAGNEGNIINCQLTGNIQGEDVIGGLVVSNLGNIINCQLTGNVQGELFVGGLVVNNDGEIKDCHFSGNISGHEEVGGLVGENNGALTSCTTQGMLTGTTIKEIGGRQIGGLAGLNYDTGTITNCSTTMEVKAIDGKGYDSFWDIGGAVGDNVGNVSGTHASGAVQGGVRVGGLIGINSGPVSNCSATGDVQGEEALTGGLIGLNREARISDCYATGNVQGAQGVGGLISSNTGDITACYATGNVVRNPLPEGIATSRFYAGGLIGTNSGGNITDCYATGDVVGNDVSEDSKSEDSQCHVGGLIGSHPNDGDITDCYATGNVFEYDSEDTSQHYTGGLIGYVYYVNITGCYATGNVQGIDYVGGLIGQNDYAGITNCNATGAVTGEQKVGGLVGYSNCGYIGESYAAGAVSGGDDVGGLVGYLLGYIENVHIEQSYAKNPSITRTDGSISTSFGRICGYNDGAKVMDNYANRNMSEPFVGAYSETLGNQKDGQGYEQAKIDAINQAVNGPGLSSTEFGVADFELAGIIIIDVTEDALVNVKIYLDDVAQAIAPVDWMPFDIQQIIDNMR